jgi:hypothetical protein
MRVAQAIAALGLLAICAPLGASASVERPSNPLRFWEGRTESSGVIKLIMHKPFHSHAIGVGQIRPDGSLRLVQRVEDEGKPPFDRIWQINAVGGGRYVGTMSQASGPVTIEDLGGKFRFRFKMPGAVYVEQWLYPNPDWKSARNELTFRKFGMQVGNSEGFVRKIG